MISKVKSNQFDVMFEGDSTCSWDYEIFVTDDWMEEMEIELNVDVGKRKCMPLGIAGMEWRVDNVGTNADDMGEDIKVTVTSMNPY